MSDDKMSDDKKMPKIGHDEGWLEAWGGFAYPTDHSGWGDPFRSDGMTLRDWFAGQALIGIISSPHRECNGAIENIVDDAYSIADFMIAERYK